MRIATLNVNGIRAAHRRGFLDWVDRAEPDVIALQEVRCPTDQIPSEVREGWVWSYHQGDIPGRNGVAILTRNEPADVRLGFGNREFDHEGRWVEVDLPGLTVASLYLPKGGTLFEDEASAEKYHRKRRFCASLARHLTRARLDATRAGREFLVMGDFNVAHTELDLKNHRSNRKSEGFLPEEREWFGSILGPRTLHDVVRRLHPEEPGPYSWWSWRGQAFTNDAGWRIDYHLATPNLSKKATSGGTHRDASYDTRISDHAPVVVDYDI
ncbi:exodeoxyribonuclease III [Propioniferax innocua]|uniref:Exodeoxyribonuclease-3 n=1 Tax=Propioniferax innocua TaxID=1753 RepID=A0A542ZSX6_9ACTN|nr:exodeoxyribonuclease III [Propioniferax innocua]TQL63349.1 exodeoxyribonuclease-3 [Propioniferax innocua]